VRASAASVVAVRQSRYASSVTPDVTVEREFPRGCDEVGGEFEIDAVAQLAAFDGAAGPGQRYRRGVRSEDGRPRRQDREHAHDLRMQVGQNAADELPAQHPSKIAQEGAGATSERAGIGQAVMSRPTASKRTASKPKAISAAFDGRRRSCAALSMPGA